MTTVMSNARLLLVCASALMVSGQVPGFGRCPDFDVQPDFDMERYLGTWYEAEHYVNVFEIGTRCVKTNYTKAADGRYLVANDIVNRFTGINRVLSGEISLIKRGSESKMSVRYTSMPIPYSTEQMILETDYDSFAVVWSCSSLGVANTQNAWVLTREKFPPGTTTQKAYEVLDKYKLRRNFFVKTDQNSCASAEKTPEKTPNKDSDNKVEQ